MQWRALFCIDHDHVKSQVKVLVALQSLFQQIFFRSHGPSPWFMAVGIYQRYTSQTLYHFTKTQVKSCSIMLVN